MMSDTNDYWYEVCLPPESSGFCVSEDEVGFLQNCLACPPHARQFRFRRGIIVLSELTRRNKSNGWFWFDKKEAGYGKKQNAY